MEIIMKKKLLALPLAMALFSVMGFAEEKVVALEQGHAIQENQFPSGYNHQARIDVDGWNVFITGSFIYWQAMEGGLDLGDIKMDPDHVTSLDQYTDVIKMNFKYKPGFKVALGTKLGEHDNWLLSAEYTWLHLSDVKEVTSSDLASGYNIDEGWGRYASDEWTYTWAKWKLRYDMIDLEMARPYYVGTNLVLKPFGALRGGLIKQYYDIIYSLTEDEVLSEEWVRIVEKSWLVGPRIGIDCDWIFFDYFRLIGNAAAGLFYQHFNTTGHNYMTRTGEDNTYYWNVIAKEGQLTPNLEGALGLGWGSYFGEHNGWHFDLSALYEVHYFFDQNKMRVISERNTAPTMTSLYSTAAGLMMHGLTVTARVDF
jgi:hypothetical protein